MAIGRVNTGGGGSGATLVITGVAGDTCTITKDGKTKSKTFGSDGKATFKGLDTGTWTVIMTNISGSTATRTVTINADYTLAISYFSATIAVTYPAGSTCTCTDGSTTLTAVGTTGSYTFTVPNAGTWTVSCTNGEKTKSENVIIANEGQAESVTITYELVLFDSDSGGDVAANSGGWDLSGGTISTSSISISCQSTSSSFGGTIYWSKVSATAKTKNTSIDFSAYTTLRVQVSASSGQTRQVKIYDSADTQKAVTNLTVGENSLDITNIDISGYVQLYTYAVESNSAALTVTKVWLT